MTELEERRAARREAEAHVDRGGACAEGCEAPACGLAVFPNGGGGIAIYPLRKSHLVIFQTHGPAALARISGMVMMGQYQPRWIN